MKKLINLCLLAAVFAGTAIHAAETPETLLIRRSLDNDKFGYRRGDLELALSAYADNFVVYQGNNTADPRGWSVLHEDKEAFAQALATDFEKYRYEIERTVPLITVREKKAIAATLDSGLVINRQTEASQPLKVRCFWTFNKVEDEWLATALVHDLGDTTAGPHLDSADAAAIIDLLQREEEGWEQGDAGGIVDLFDAEFIGYDGVETSAPATWKILFSNAAELDKWLSKRLAHTTYKIDRKVLYTAVGKDDKEALALTREKLTTGYESGPVEHRKNRYVLWTLSQRSGSWKITNMLYNLGLPD